jgi:hypothetical protein
MFSANSCKYTCNMIIAKRLSKSSLFWTWTAIPKTKDIHWPHYLTFKKIIKSTTQTSSFELQWVIKVTSFWF